MDYKRNFITAEEGQRFSFPYDWKQTFAHPFEMSRAANEAQIVKTYVAEEADRQIGLEVLKLLFEFTFATRDQLERLLRIKGMEEVDRLDDLLTRYLDRRLLNRFTLSSYTLGSIPDDAFVIYCLDHGARHILSHFYQDDIGVTWKSTNSYRSAEQVAKYLVTNEFYLSLMGVKRDLLAFFSPTVDYSIRPRESSRSRDIRMSAAFRIMRGATPVDFILEAVRSSDIPTYWTKKVNSQLMPFIRDRFWSRYFRLEPTFIFLAEKLDQALELSEIFQRGTGSDKFRVTTDKDLSGGIDKATFYKYEAASGVMMPVKAPIFQGNPE